MKSKTFLLAVCALALAATPALAQFGGGGRGGPSGPRLGGALSRLFGDNNAFSAATVMATKGGGTPDASVPGKLVFDDGRTRFELDITKVEGSQMPPGAGEQLKAMGMAELVLIARPEKKLSYVVYPGLQAYAETVLKDEQSAEVAKKFKVETTKLGEEKMDGQACIKNKVVVTDDKGTAHESTTWNATALKGFPIRIETTQDGSAVILTFTDIKLAKPDAAQFDPPAAFTKYDSVQRMMTTEMMKKLGGGGVPK
ncbi:MAG: hypothetical protein HY301_20015 [Verrucomicrobia bacterium]|nr:hypothetical protein [Verrucomicrobiota bacterium]